MGEVQDIARRKPGGDDEGGDDKPMSSYDDVEGDALKELTDEIGEKGANAVRDYVKACIQKATEDDGE